MIFKLAWRNIWRNPTRSAVVIGAIIIGIWSVIFLLGIIYGMINSYIDNAIQKETSHIQIHNKDFPKEKEVKYYINDTSLILDKLDKVNTIKSSTMRSISNAMIGSSHGTRGIKVNGIMPGREFGLTGIDDAIKEGKFLKNDNKKHILISTRLAKKLKVKIRSKVVLTFQTIDGEIISGAFRVIGLFKTGNAMYDENTALVNINSLNFLLGKNNIAHQAMIYLNDIQQLDTTVVQLKKLFPNLLVQSYKEVAPELELFQNQIGNGGLIYMFIFMLALIFGIINTMLMAVLERVRELGMLMAVGMNKIKIFFMIVIETIILAFLGAPIGLAIGYFFTSYFNKHGINLFFFGKESMAQFGMSNFIYPTVESQWYLILVIAIIITAVIASIYPAIKAIRLNPVEAIRKV